VFWPKIPYHFIQLLILEPNSFHTILVHRERGEMGILL
jgi:hypothetical protein